MRVRLIRQARVTVKAGETVEVSPAEAVFLISTHQAVEAAAAKETPAVPETSTDTKEKGKK